MTALPKRVRNHVNPLADQTEINFGGFANAKPIMIDIGAYRGEFSQQLVEQFGDTHNFIVTEIRKPYANYLRELFQGNTNVAVFDGDSARNIRGLLESSIKKGVLIDYVFINFPDPWFKEKHKKRRVVNHDFLNTLKDLLQTQAPEVVPRPGCISGGGTSGCGTSNKTKIIFQTDQKPLFDETVELIQENRGWQVEHFDNPLWGIQSHWENTKVAEGNLIYRVQISLHL